MTNTESTENQAAAIPPFYERPGVHVEQLPIGPGIPIGIERVSNPDVGIAGAYGAWGTCYDNTTLPGLIESRLGSELTAESRLNLSDLGFLYRHHIPKLSEEEDIELELQVGSRLLAAAAEANGWEPGEVDAVLIGSTVPIVPDLLERIARSAGIREDALKVSVHKACDGGVGSLNLALNPELATGSIPGRNLALELRGKKVLFGGIEGLSRVIKDATDRQALQLFANGAGVFGIVPGRTMKFIAGGSHEVFDEEGLLQVRMSYPHSRKREEGKSNLEVHQLGANSYRVAGLQHEPGEGAGSVVMAGPMGMVKLFVRSGVTAVRSVYASYKERLGQMRMSKREIAVAIVHHANYKINLLKAKQLEKEGISFPMPWLVSDFGNVSAASAMIALARKLPSLLPGDHVLIDGFGAGTYYDVVAVEMGSMA